MTQRGELLYMDSFKKELDFGLDNFQQQKILSNNDSVARVLLNLFLMKPGNMPSLPHIGINIKEYLYKMNNQLDPDELKDKIYNQCSELIPYLALGAVKIFATNYKGKDLLIISVPIQNMSANTADSVLYGFSKDDTENVVFNYQFEDNINN